MDIDKERYKVLNELYKTGARNIESLFSNEAFIKYNNKDIGEIIDVLVDYYSEWQSIEDDERRVKLRGEVTKMIAQGEIDTDGDYADKLTKIMLVLSRALTLNPSYYITSPEQLLNAKFVSSAMYEILLHLNDLYNKGSGTWSEANPIEQRAESIRMLLFKVKGMDYVLSFLSKDIEDSDVINEIRGLKEEWDRRDAFTRSINDKSEEYEEEYNKKTLRVTETTLEVFKTVIYHILGPISDKLIEEIYEKKKTELNEENHIINHDPIGTGKFKVFNQIGVMDIFYDEILEDVDHYLSNPNDRLVIYNVIVNTEVETNENIFSDNSRRNIYSSYVNGIVEQSMLYPEDELKNIANVLRNNRELLY